MPTRQNVLPLAEYHDVFGADAPMPDASECRAHVVQAINATWAEYAAQAMGADELRPVSRAGRPCFTESFGFMVAESLDTLWLAGLHDEFATAAAYAEQHVRVPRWGLGLSRLPFTDGMSRLVGGLMAGYGLSGRKGLLAAATAVADALYDGAVSSGTPVPERVVSTGWPSAAAGVAGKVLNGEPPHTLAELGAPLVDLRVVAHFAKEPRFARLAAGVEQAVRKQCPRGACPLHWRRNGSALEPGRVAGLDAQGLAYYDGLLKGWLASRMDDDGRRGAWMHAGNVLQAASELRDGWFVPSLRFVGPHIDHRTCAAGATYALSYIHTHHAPHLEMAQRVTHECVRASHVFSSQLQPALLVVAAARNVTPWRREWLRHGLWPETVESCYYVWRATRDERYRKAAWRMFAAMTRSSRVASGAYSSVDDASAPRGAALGNRMETAFMARTLKFLLLTFSDDEQHGGLAASEDWVVNAAGHVLKTFD